jgi:ABC-type transport system substrate-binding protein
MKGIGIKVNVDVIDYSVIDERQSRGEWDMVLAAMNFAMVRDSYYILDSNFKTGGSSNH